ncbi:MAG: helix-turn-helix domain-containing protein [Thermoanaerobaculia bacterium]
MREAEDRLWGIEEVALFLGVPVSAVYKMTGPRSRTPIPHVKIGGRLRFRRTDIEAWLDLLSVSNLERLAKAKRAAFSVV